MNVEDLIAALSKLDPKLLVNVRNSSGIHMRLENIEADGYADTVLNYECFLESEDIRDDFQGE